MKQPHVGDDENQKDRIVVGIGVGAESWHVAHQIIADLFCQDVNESFLETTNAPPPPIAVLLSIVGECRIQSYKNALGDRLVVVSSTPMEIREGTVFAASHGMTLKVSGNQAFALQEDVDDIHLPVDSLLSDLAVEFGEQAVGIVLSGKGTDGTLGLRAISDGGGMTVTQVSESAIQPSMPESAAALGVIDHILMPETIPTEVRNYAQHMTSPHSSDPNSTINRQIVSAIPQIAAAVEKYTQHDFKHYKITTLARRIRRRIHILKLPTVDSYIEMLLSSREESLQLFRELLISVTAFFRDPNAFDALASDVLDPMIQSHDQESTIRIWVPGCATGQEAYSIAMLMSEAMQRTGKTLSIQIFATDLDERSLSIARAGDYPMGIQDEVPPNRLEKFFTKRGNRYFVTKRIRDMIIFSGHNLISDPPFTKLDLVSCRNLLIYLGSHLQKKLIPLFHFSIKPGGYLFLGPAESLSVNKELFRTLDPKHRLFQRRLTALDPPATLDISTLNLSRLTNPTEASSGDIDLFRYAQQIVLGEFSPQWVVVDDDGEIHSLSSDPSPFLQLAGGRFRNNVISMAHEHLRIGLRAAFAEAKRYRRRALAEDMSIPIDGGIQRVHITVQPMPQMGANESLHLVCFHRIGTPLHVDIDPVSEPSNAASASVNRTAAKVIEQLEQELFRTREALDGTVQELESSNEELKSANEELLSMNEEMQSANEELETAKEELQTSNDLLIRSNNDIQNLLRSTRIATVFLDNEIRIRSFTPAIEQVYELNESDIGRPLTLFVPKVGTMPDLPNPVDLHGDDVIEERISTRIGRTFLRRVIPYRSPEGDSDGIVVTYNDVTELSDSQQLFKALVDTSSQIVWTTDANGKVVDDSPSWRAFTGQTFEQWIHDGWLNVVHPDDRQGIVDQWRICIDAGTELDWEYRLLHHHGEYRWTQVRAIAQRNADGSIRRWIGMNSDINDRKQAEKQLLDAKDRLQLSLEVSDVAPWNLDLRNNHFGTNPILNRLFGFSEEVEPSLSDFIERIDSSFRERVSQAIAHSIQTGATYDQEYPVNLPDGQTRYVRARGRVRLSDDHLAEVFYGVVIDITDRKRREIDLVEREAHLRRVINNQLGLVGVIDRNGILLEVDDRSLEIARSRREDVLGKHFADAPWWRYDPAVAQRMRAAMERAFAGEVVRYDVSLYSRGDDGVMIDFMIAPVFDETGKVEYLIPSGVDIRDRYAAENRLKESESRFRAMADGLPLLVWVHDPEGNQVTVNQAYCDFYSVEEEQMREMQWQKLVHPEDFRAYTDEFARCVQTQSPFHAETRVKRADGQWSWLESWGRPHFSKSGKYLGHIGGSADVTDRKRAEFQLQFIAELQAELDPLTCSQEIGAVAIDKVYRWLQPSQCALVQFLPDSEDAEVFQEKLGDGLLSAIGCHLVSDFLDPIAMETLRANRPVVIDEIASDKICILKSEQPSDLTVHALLVIPYVCENILKFALVITNDQPRQWQSHETDLLSEVVERLFLRLERTWAEEKLVELAAQLHETNERLRLATSAARMGMFDWNIDTDVNVWDAQHLELTGLKNVQPSGQLFLSCVHPDDVIANNEAIAKAIEDGNDYNIEFRFRRPDGKLRWLAARGRVVQGADGCRHFIGLNWDVTDRQEIEQSLTKAREAAEAANTSKSEFLANMSHEIRTPMTAILGYTDLIAEKVVDDETLQFVNTIRRNGGFLLDIINDILDLSKIEAGKFDIREEVFSPIGLVEDVRSIMSVRATEKGIQLEVRYTTPLPALVQCDSKRLKQILINLIGNAIKFTPEGNVTVSVTYEKPLLRFEIVDTGIGMSASQLNRLFRPFSQGDGNVNREFGGTGLGLAISKRLAEMLGGQITVQSELAHGSTFKFQVRAKTVTNDLKTQTEFAMVTGQSPMLNEPIRLTCDALVVDDRRDIRFLSRRILEKAGATVTEAEDGELAIEVVLDRLTQHSSFDVILLDMQMPKLDGYATATALRKLGYDGPIIALTADAMQGDMNRCLNAGCNDYLSKPIDAALMIQKLKKYVEL